MKTQQNIHSAIQLLVVSGVWGISLLTPHLLSAADLEQIIPSAAGRVSHTFAAAAPATATDPATPKEVFLIQDVHANGTAHKNIAAILDALIQAEGLTTVMVEGAAGNVDVAYLRERISGEALRERTAESLLQQGLIAGFEYLQWTTTHPFELWGIEDQALYKDNYQAYLSAQEAAHTLTHELAPIEERIAQLRAPVWPAALQQLIGQYEHYTDGDADISTYLQALKATAEQAGIAIEDAHVRQFQKILQIEAQLDPQQVTAQQQALLQQLSAQAPKEHLQGLIAAAKQMKGGGDVHLFYTTLLDLTQQHLPQADTTLIQEYATYLQLKTDLDVAQFLKGVDAATYQVAEALLDSPQGAQLWDAWQKAALLGRLAALEWTPPDRQRFAQHQRGVEQGEWATNLNALALQQGLDPIENLSEEATAALAECLRFYAIAEARNAAMAQRIQTKMADAAVERAALVVGGFHTEALGALLAGAGFKVTVVTPLVGPQPDAGLYDYVMRFKHGYYKQQGLFARGG